MANFDQIILHTPRCTLRPWTIEDAERLSSIANTTDISWNTSYRFPYPFDKKAAVRFITNNTMDPGIDKWQFAITLNNDVIGGCGTLRGTGVESHIAEVGYWLGVDWWGQNFASETLQALISFMREQTDIEQLSASCFGWNPASRRVLEKNGFINEGVRKRVVKKWDKTTDLWIYGLLLR